MPPRTFRLFALTLLLLLPVVACDTAPPRPQYPDIRFSSQPQIRLAVATVDIRSDFKPSFQPPHVEHLFPVPPQRALENWAHDRLVAAGGALRARFTIADASIIEVELKKKSEGLTAAFKKESAQRYDGTVAATLEILDERGLPVRSVSVKATRSQAVLEGISPNERDQTWYDMTKALMTEFDQQLSAEIGAHFGGYFQ